MAEYFRITDKTLHWFLPLLPKSEKDALEAGRDVYAIGAACEKRACGILVFRMGEMADIRYFAVAEEYRRKGIAAGMVGFLCRHMWESVTPVTCTFSARDMQDPVYSFFNSMWNFSIAQEEGFACRVPLAALAENKFLAPLKEKKTEHPSFFSLTPLEQKDFFRQMQEEGNFYLREIRKEEYVKPLCLCGMDGKQVKAAIFVTKAEEGAADLELAYAWCAKGWQKTLVELLAQAAAKIPAGAEGCLYISAVTQASAAIVEKLLPERETLSGYYRAVWDMEL